ncbi:MAG TPA: PEGA domain-containing protein [Nannocystaceae bacterium]|nr:PEGA domain-containing protein [Nannocystaceae bacterium]
MPAFGGAPEKQRIVVLAPQLDGDVSAGAAAEVDGALRDGLSRGDVEVVSSDIPGASCADAECRRAAASDARAAAVIAVRVAAVRRDYDVTLTLIDGASGEEVARVERRCELCGVAELGEHVDGQAAALLSRLQSPQAAPATLAVSSTPSGALVRLDDAVVGETPIERRVELGTHVLRLSLRGYVDELRRFEALAGVREAIAIDMVPLPNSDERRRLRAGGFVSLALGTAAIATGLTLVVLHDRPNQTMCRGKNVDDDGDCKFLYATKIPGAIVTSVGVAALVAGITMLAVEHRKRRARR